MLEEELLEIYVDGSVIGKSGAVAVKIKEILPNGDESYREFLSRQFSYVKSGQLEIVACTCALDEVANQGFLRGKTRVVIYTDSKYVVDSVDKGWVFGWVKKGFKDKKNVDLWKRFLLIYPRHDVKFKWVKGHAANPLNERCDQLAVAASNSRNLLVDEGYEASKKDENLF